MKKPNRSNYGYSKKTGWQNERDRDLYDAALLEWYKQPRKTGKVRIHPIHESWNKILKYFDSSNPQRSQGAFCRWANIKPASFSSKKVKPLGDDLERFVLEWIGIFGQNE
jgi:hypothetical protein